MAEPKLKTPLEQLLRAEPGKAEIVKGQVIRMAPTGVSHGIVVGNIFVALRLYQAASGAGVTFGDNVGFLVDLPHRQSFSPDAAYYTGPLGESGAFLPAAPVFAVEVRSPSDYGPAAEREMRAKRADYFSAGTLVVWDVDVLREQTI